MLHFFILFLSTVEIARGGYDDRLVTVDYMHTPDELGRTVMLECCTNGVSTRKGEVPDYEWERYITEPPMPSSAVGVNTHTLFLPNFTTADIGLYRCKITGFVVRYSAYVGVGSTGLVSAPGTISYGQYSSYPPRLDCQESSSAPYTTFNYIFYRHHAPMPSNAYIDRRSLYIPGFDADDAGIYSCIAFNLEGISYGHPYDWYDSQPDPPPTPTITQHDPTEDLKTGTIMTLTCCSASIPPPQYVWFKRNWVSGEPELMTNAAGVYSSTLYVSITGVVDGGVYICTAFHSGGSSYTEVLLDLSPEGPPYFLTFSPSPISISQHQQKYISCVAGGDPFPTMSWRRVNGSLPPFTFSDSAGLYVTALEGSDVSGVYVCTATNVNGIVEKFFEVRYVSSNTEPPTVSTTAEPTESLEPPVNVTVTGETAVVEGADLILNCSAVGDPEPTLQWLRSGDSLPSKVTDASSPQLVVPSMTWSDVGVYYCLAVNAGGVSYSPAIYVLLQAEEGAVISYGKSQQKGLNEGLLGGVLGGVIAVVLVLSVAAAAFIYYMSRPVEHAVEKTTVWDVMMGAHKGKNVFDIMIKVRPAPEGQPREPSFISLSSSIMSALNIAHVIERPFECEQKSQKNMGEVSGSEGAESVIAEDQGRGTDERHLCGDVGRGCNDGDKDAGEHERPTSVVVDVVMEETRSN